MEEKCWDKRRKITGRWRAAQMDSPQALTAQHMVSSSNRTVQLPSAELSQKQELAECDPAPFFCIIVQVTMYEHLTGFPAWWVAFMFVLLHLWFTDSLCCGDRCCHQLHFLQPLLLCCSRHQQGKQSLPQTAVLRLCSSVTSASASLSRARSICSFMNHTFGYPI